MIQTIIGLVTIFLVLGTTAILLKRLKNIMINQAQLAAALVALTATVTKIGTETATLKTKVEELTLALENSGQLSQEVQDALTGLTAQIQVVDDLVPDATTNVEAANAAAPAEDTGGM